jgi:hypothetical protein
MNGPEIVLQAAVDDSEQPAVRLAAERLASSLSTAAGHPVTVRCSFVASHDALDWSAADPVVISSLLPEVANYREPWPQVESRLRAAYQALAAKEGAVIFIATVLRHVPRAEAADRSELKLVRIRRLNLLAAELSRETGAYVIDLDRSLADIGASKLQTDYRLNGQYAAEAAAKFIALALLSAGLDAYVSFEIQDAAKAIIAGTQLNLIVPAVAAPDIVPSNVLKLGAGRRKQVVATVVDTDKDSHAGWLIHLLVTRQFGIGEALTKLKQSVARRGVRSSVVMVVAAIRQALRGRSRVGR